MAGYALARPGPTPPGGSGLSSNCALTGTTAVETVTASGTISSTVAANAVAFSCATNGACRIQPGASSSRYFTDDGVSTLVANGDMSFTANLKLSTADASVLGSGSGASGSGITMRSNVLNAAASWGVSIGTTTNMSESEDRYLARFVDNISTAKLKVTATGSLQQTPATLGTCAAALEGLITLNAATGAATGARTNLCLCTSNGSSTYAWQSLVTGTVGTATTCVQ